MCCCITFGNLKPFARTHSWRHYRHCNWPVEKASCMFLSYVSMFVFCISALYSRPSNICCLVFRPQGCNKLDLTWLIRSRCFTVNSQASSIFHHKRVINRADLAYNLHSFIRRYEINNTQLKITFSSRKHATLIIIILLLNARTENCIVADYKGLIGWLIFIKSRNKRTCNEYNNSDNESDTA